MASLTLRSIKGVPLTNNELDANFTALNTELGQKLVATSNLGDLTDFAAARTNLGLGSLATQSSLKTVNGQSVLGSGNIQIDGGVTSFNTRTGAVTLGSGDVTGALGFTPVNKAGDTMSGNLTVANGTDSRVNLQVSGVTEGILTANSTNVRLSSANAIPITIGTNGVTRLTFTGTGFITTGASEYVGIGAQAGTNNGLRVARNLENGPTAFGVVSDGTFQSVVTTTGVTYRSVARTADAAFTMASLHHFQAVQATLGSGSAITSQSGFVADSSLVGATNNYGFYGNIPSGTNRWNLYMPGTASNHLAGPLGINTTFLNDYLLRVGGSITGATTRGAVEVNSTAASDVTSEARGIVSAVSTAASSFTVGQTSSFLAAQGTIGAGSSVATQVGFLVASSFIGGGNNYGFRGAIPSGSNRFNLYMDGTADNYLAGNTGIGASPAANARLRVVGSGASSEVARIEGATLDAQHIINQTDDPATNTSRAQLSLRKNNVIGATISIDGASANRGIVYYDAYSATGSHAFYVNSTDRFRINAVGAVSFTGSYGTAGQMLKSGGSAGVPTWGSLTSGEVTTALGFTPYNSTNPSSYIDTNGTARTIVESNGTVIGTRRALNFIPGTGISLSITDDAANEEVDITITSTVTGGVTTFNTRSGAVTLSSSDVTGALGFTPYNSSNPSGYITSSALSSYLPLSGGTLTGTLTGTTVLATLENSNARLKFKAADADGGTFALLGLDWGGAVGTYKDFEVYDYVNGRPMIRVLGANRDVVTYGKVTLGTFPNSTTNSGEAWIGRASDRSAGTMTVQLGSGSDRIFEVVDSAWSTVILAAGMNTLTYKGSALLHAGNVSSYALPLTGGALSGVLTINSTSDNQLLLQSTDSWTGIGFNDSAPLAADYIWHNGTNGTFSLGGGGANVSGKKLHVHGGMTVGAGYAATSNPSNGLNVEGAIQQGGNQVLHAGNYTSYSPSLGGSGASGTWGISVSGSAGSAGWSTYSQILDTRAGQYTPNDYQDYRTTYEFTDKIVGSDWHTAMTMQGWNNGYSAWQIIGPASTSAHENWYLRSGINTSWNSLRTILHSGNYSSYALPLSGGTLSGDVTFGSSNTYFGGSVYLRANTAFSFLTNSGSAQNARFNGIQVSSSYSGSIPTNGILFFTDTALVRNTANELDLDGRRLLHAGNITSTSSANGINPDNVDRNQIGYNTSVSLFGQSDGGLYSSAYSSAWIHQIYGDFRTGQIAIRGKNSGTWQAWRTVLDSSNFSSYAVVRTSAGRPGVTKLYRNESDDAYNVQTTWSVDASGYWSLRGYLNDGYHAPCYVGLSGRSNRANGNFYIDDNYGCGIVGAYSSTRYQGVFAMGDSYKLPASGETTGSLYGMAWSHPNAGGVAGNLDSHGMIVMINGGFGSCMSYSIRASGNVTAYSDERLKTNWRDMPENFVARLAQVKVGIYDRIDGDKITQVGVGAQSFQQLLPQAITTANDEMKTLSVNYGGAALASAVELAKDNVELRARIERLESLINKLIGD